LNSGTGRIATGLEVANMDLPVPSGRASFVASVLVSVAAASAMPWSVRL
jgi:hypothetical protein